ncbi:MAG TPA: CRISPR-associated protein Cas4 [Candidatus Desulfofervidus auxilii]|uniref:CRISPR-associated exonuclease Cas4 n=1 Tax=Desulfofervidus auxilii TaxID=1621989 RepID=A0A7C0U2E3_DESA2|nr:CRISPR-associated protein Cas4 [Candidatus Desulfofervidus auxilii]
MRITGALVNAFYICPRKAWLLAHEFGPDPENVFIELGRILSEETYRREKKEIVLENMKIDLIKRAKEDVIVGEVKKSSKGHHAAKMQLVFYLYQLKQYGISAKGELLIPKEKKKFKIELTQELEDELKQTFLSIKKTINQTQPPLPKKSSFCRNCAYKDFCWV